MNKGGLKETGYPESYTENTTLKGNEWNTLTVDLSKLNGAADFNYNQIKIHQILITAIPETYIWMTLYSVPACR